MIKPQGTLPGANATKPCTPVCTGVQTHTWYFFMSSKHSQPHTNGAHNIHLSPITGVFSTPTQLPSMWGAQHTISTSSCHPRVLYPRRMGYPTFIKPKYRCAQHKCTTPIHVGHASHIPTSPRPPSFLNPPWTGHPTHLYIYRYFQIVVHQKPMHLADHIL